MSASGRSTLPTCLRHDAGDQLLHALAVARRTGNRSAIVILQAQEKHRFFPTVQTLIFVRRHECDLPFVECANSPPASTTVTRDAGADLVIATDPPEWEAQGAGTLSNHHTLRFLAVLSFLGRFHGETSFRDVRRRHSLRVYLSEYTCGSVLCPVGTAGAGEFVSERAQGGVESSSPSFFRRYYDNPP